MHRPTAVHQRLNLYTGVWSLSAHEKMGVMIDKEDWRRQILEIYLCWKGKYSKTCINFIATLLWENSGELFVSSFKFICKVCCGAEKQISQQNRFVSRVTRFAESRYQSHLFSPHICEIQHFADISEQRAILELEEKKWGGVVSSCNILFDSPPSPQFHTTAFVLVKSWNKLFLDLVRHSSLHIQSFDVNA